MNREFVDIVTSVSNYEECQYRLGGGCKATSIGECSKKCKFFTPSLSLSNYQQKAVIAFKAQKERIAELRDRCDFQKKEINSLEAENSNLKKIIEALENEIEIPKREGVINGK